MKLITAFLFTLFVSCHSHRTYSFYEYNIGIHLQTSLRFNSISPESDGESISVGFKSEVNKFNDAIRINSVVLNDDNHYHIENSTYKQNLSSDLFGNKLYVQIDTEVVVSNFYCPERLKVRYDVPKHQMDMYPGMVFNWTPDPQSQGVTVTLMALPSSNSGLESRIEVSANIRDNGRFDVPEKWIKQFPKNTFVDMRMERINQHIYQTEKHRKVLVKGSSTCFGSFFIRDKE